MKHLLKKLIRDVRRSLGQFIAVTIVCAIGVSLLTGISVTYSSMKNMADTFYRQSNLADMSCYYLGMDDAGIEKIKSIPGVADAYGRLSLPASGSGFDFLLHSISQDEKINIPDVSAGKYPQAADECMFDEAFARSNGLSVGSRISSVISGKPYGFTVSGLFNTAEHVYLVEDPAKNPMPDHKAFGLLYVDRAFFGNLGLDAPYNEVLITLKQGANASDVKNAVEKATQSYGLGQTILQKDQPSYSQLDSDIETLHAFATSFPYIFFLVAAAIVFISMSRTIQSERNQIGIMKALGVKNSFITHYLGYPVFSGIIGSVIGNPLGALAFPPILFGVYRSFYTFAAILINGYWPYIVISTVIVILFGVAATVLSTRRVLKETPAHCMRPVPPPKVHKTWLEKREAFWSRTPYKYKLIIRNILLNKSRAILSSIGIIGCFGVLMCGFGLQDETNNLYVSQFTKVQLFDDMALLSNPVPYPSKAPFTDHNILQADPFTAIPATISLGKDISSVLYALPENNSSIRLYDNNNAAIPLPGDGIVFPYKLAREYNIKAGDTVTLRLGSALYGNKAISVKVAAVGVEYLSQDIYASYACLQRLDVTPYINGYYVTLGDKSLLAQTTDSIAKAANIKSVARQDDLRKSFHSMMNIMYALMFIMLIMSGALSLAVIYNISSINIFERRRDIATLKVLGYHKREINSLIHIENLIITAVGCLLGVGFGAIIYRYLLTVMVSADMYFPYGISAYMIVCSLALAFAFTLLTNFMLRGKTGRIDMVESLKSVE